MDMTTPDEFKDFLIKEGLHADKSPHTGIYRQSNGEGVGCYYRAEGGNFEVYVELGVLTGKAHLMDELTKKFEHIISTADCDLVEQDITKAFEAARAACDVRKGT